MTKAEQSARLRICAWESRVAELRKQLEVRPDGAYPMSSGHKELLVFGRSLAAAKDDLTRAEGASIHLRDSARQQFEALREQYKAECDKHEDLHATVLSSELNRLCRSADLALCQWIDAPAAFDRACGWARS